MNERIKLPTVTTVSLLVVALALLLLTIACQEGASQTETSVRNSGTIEGSAGMVSRLVSKTGSRSVQEQLANSENERIYDEIWSLVNQHFLYRDRLKAWPIWRHKYDGQMYDKTNAQFAINTMLDSLGDEYTFFRDESATEQRKSLRVKPRVVEYKMLEEGQIGYIHITTFNSVYCVPEFKNALAELIQAHGLILDLRDNWGGSINTTFDVFSLCSSAGKFVTMRGTTDTNEYSEEMSVTEDGAFNITDGVVSRTQREINLTGGKPLVVLVNENTKSAAEMLAGALRDNGRATLIGSRTYGKGIVQRVWEFPNDTSIKIASARFYLPNGEFIHRTGITPDVYVDNRTLAKTKNIKGVSNKILFGKNATVMSRRISTSENNKSHKVAQAVSAREVETERAPGNDLQLDEAQAILKRKLVSLAK